MSKSQRNALLDMVFENHRKSLILQLCERSELRLQFEWTKFTKNAQNIEMLRRLKKSNETF